MDARSVYGGVWGVLGRCNDSVVTDLSGCESAPAAIDASDDSAGSWGIDALWCSVDVTEVAAEDDRGLATPAVINWGLGSIVLDGPNARSCGRPDGGRCSRGRYDVNVEAILNRGVYQAFVVWCLRILSSFELLKDAVCEKKGNRLWESVRRVQMTGRFVKKSVIEELETARC
ncbi:hypothetical protein VE03_04371 [Pseudogymnoascus sp. 23342-1-I1]|nr:hypothetical protein VE03_04371 [Pseudogymnoascus sp. 23342-1-I1]